MTRRLLLTVALLTWASFASAQIAFDAATNGGLVNPATSLTFSHTTSGSNRILFVGCFGDTTDVLTGATYNAVSMTLVGKIQTGNGTERWEYLWHLEGPTSGSNSVVVSAGSLVAIDCIASSYTGASQTGQVDASTTNNAGAGATLAVSVTTVADNAWTVASVRMSAQPTAGASTTERSTGTNGQALFDSNALVHPAGSATLNFASGPGNGWGVVMASFSPAGGGGGASPCLLRIMGVGCVS